jgi:AcrR family transcriptional regulator
MARRYELKQRAMRQEETRLRIVEAAIDLHGSVGPARTTVSAIAERAGVQRHTYYRHFPDERSLMHACSGLHLERNPLPDPSAWRSIADPKQRMRRGLAELYAFFERNEAILANVIRDAEVDPVTREAVELRIGPRIAEIQDALAAALPRRGKGARAALGVALEFHTWQVLVRRGGVSSRRAATIMADMLLCAGEE